MSGILVCLPRGYFADDVQTRCAQCDAAIVHRPYAAPGLVKICVACAVAMMNESTAPLAVAVTDESIQEAALYLAKTKGVQ